MTPYEEAVERRARAMALGDGRSRRNWDTMMEHGKDWWKSQARATFTADDKAGYALVPKVATEALVRAERKLTAYVGVCKDDKELTNTVLPMIRQALSALEDGT